MKIRNIIEDDRQALQDVIHSNGIFTVEEKKIALELIDTCLNQSNQKDYEIDVIENSAGTTMGFVCYGPTPLTEGTLDIYWLTVHSSSHKQGFGKALLNWVEKTAIDRRTRLILIETSSNAKYASTRRFYERRGYNETARVRDFYRPGDDRIIYCKYLPPGKY